MKSPSGFCAKKGFTLIELLTVIGIIVILGAILLPALSGARKSSLKAKSKAQFSQWIAAVEGFRQEYGYYPFLSSSGDTTFAINDGGNRVVFETLLNGSDKTLNRKGIRFYTLSGDELVDPGASNSSICDAFGNTKLYLLLDGDRDGLIQSSLVAQPIRGSVEVLAVANDLEGYPEVKTWYDRN